MAVEDKYLLKEAVRYGISNEERYKDLVDFTIDMNQFIESILHLFVLDYKQKNLNIKKLDNIKNHLNMMRKSAKSKKFKYILDEYIEFIEDISEGYWENVDTSREGT